ncbi:MAG: glutamate-1-semialdehyde-2,1-aminomutase [Spirochaetes bacterium GWF1_51_8]|nr:MAG: glutamate-1-semialdehyde-2,1-aminomutase [Spirochaetes bacterium GWF1_51_8]
MPINLYEEALKVIPGGVNSPVRSFASTGLPPLFIGRAKGKHLYSCDNKRYLDFCMSWGAVILGHADPGVNRAAKRAIGRGSTYALCHPAEAELARLIIAQMPSIGKIRFVNSGTEAVMSAVRLARAYTGKSVIVKFDGCYHGHSDSLLVKAGSGIAEAAIPGSPGVPGEIVRNTVSIPFNNTEVLTEVLRKYKNEIACVLMEPVPGNMGLVPPRAGYLEFVRKLTTENGVLLIFDEVITGFRVGLGGVQGIEGIAPDLTTLGKIIGGGLPCGAFGGRAEIMDMLAPSGPVYQAGTLSGNPVAMAAGIAVIKKLTANPGTYSGVTDLVSGFAAESGVKRDISVNTYRTLFSVFHTPKKVENYEDAKTQNFASFREAYRRLFEHGILLPPSPFETSFLTALHNQSDLSRILSLL